MRIPIYLGLCCGVLLVGRGMCNNKYRCRYNEPARTRGGQKPSTLNFCAISTAKLYFRTRFVLCNINNIKVYKVNNI